MYCIKKMIPIFHAAGHLASARCARRYIDSMRNLPNIMSEEQYNKISSWGLFTIRRSDNYWGGMFSDQVIDQSLMRVIKASGGLARGRGITPNTEAKFIHVLPKWVPVCNALEEFSGVHIVDHLIIILIYTQVPHYAIFTTIRNTLIGWMSTVRSATVQLMV